MIIEIKVHPKSKAVKVQKTENRWEMWVKSSPTKNQANDEALDLLSKELGVPKSKIELTSGFKSRLKRFRVNI